MGKEEKDGKATLPFHLTLEFQKEKEASSVTRTTVHEHQNEVENDSAREEDIEGKRLASQRRRNEN